MSTTLLHEYTLQLTNSLQLTNRQMRKPTTLQGAAQLRLQPSRPHEPSTKTKPLNQKQNNQLMTAF
eukprot:scaffold641_cov237-Pinguiococcus_pyrenoidosus.AAC.19